MTQNNTDHTNFELLFNDLELDQEKDLLWLMHHQKHYWFNEVKSLPAWNTKKNIFLLDCEVLHFVEDTEWKKDPRVNVWAPCVYPHERFNTYHFWFNWMQEVENYLKFTSKLESTDFKPYHFDALLGTPRDHKGIVKQYIDNSKNKKDFLLSYYENGIDNWILGFDNEDVENFNVYFNGKQFTNVGCVVPYKIYNQCWYSLVAETNGTYPNMYSEKTGKVLLGKRVFVMFSGQWHLKHLKDFGFKTFDGIIDESYDEIEDIEIRYQEAWKQVEFLMQQDPVEVYKQAEPILEHNYNHFMSTNWQKEMYEKIQNISHLSK